MSREGKGGRKGKRGELERGDRLRISGYPSCIDVPHNMRIRWMDVQIE